MAEEIHWIIKTIFALLLGAVAWAVSGFVLNVLIPILGAVICCEHLGGEYYEFAFWFPLAAWGLVTALILGLLLAKPLPAGE